MRGISGLFQNYNVGMLLLEGPRRRLKGSKETSTKLCVMKRLLSIAEATAHEITPGDYAKKKEVLQRQRGWAQGSRTASSGIWPPHCNTTFGSQTSGQNGPAWRWPLQYARNNNLSRRPAFSSPARFSAVGADLPEHRRRTLVRESSKLLPRRAPPPDGAQVRLDRGSRRTSSGSRRSSPSLPRPVLASMKKLAEPAVVFREMVWSRASLVVGAAAPTFPSVLFACPIHQTKRRG